MFDFIPPTDHDSFRERINNFLKDLKTHNSDLYGTIKPKSKATFILAQENSYQIEGGAILFQQKPSSLHTEVQGYIKDNGHLSESVWAGTLYLHFEDEIQGHIFESLCKVFYQYLYESLLTFGVQEQTSFLCLTLDPCEHLSTELIGLWPYKVQVRHRESPDGLFHGVLALTGNQNKLKGFAA